tara:strand:+ start:370 stop:678 length:309 start_codon:yes stop_codon:yes gene_type:complete
MEKDNNQYRPLPNELTIRESSIEGLGLFAVTIIEEGVNLGLTHKKDAEARHGLLRTPLGGFINHSDNPNCELVSIGPRLFLSTIKDIMPDEELTLKYRYYDV